MLLLTCFFICKTTFGQKLELIFEKLIPWQGDTLSMAVDVLKTEKDELLLLTSNYFHYPSSGIFFTVGSGIIKLSSQGDTICRRNYLTNTSSGKIEPGLSPLWRIPARELFIDQSDQFVLPFVKFTGPKPCFSGEDPNSYEIRVLKGSTLDCRETINISIVNDSSCTSTTLIQYATKKSGEHLFLYSIKNESGKKVVLEEYNSDLLLNWKKEIFESDYVSGSAYINHLFDAQNGHFVFVIHNLLLNKKEVVCIDNDGNEKWINSNTLDGSQRTTIHSFSEFYLISQVIVTSPGEYHSVIYKFSSESDSLLETIEFPSVIIRDISVSENRHILILFDGLIENSSDSTPVHISLYKSNFEEISSANFGFSKVSCERIKWVDKNQFVIIGGAIDGDNSGQVYLLMGKVAISELTCPEIKIYPNPSSQKLIIESELNQMPFETYNAEIFNTRGENVMNFVLERDPFELDITGIAEGLYYLRINNCELKKQCPVHKIIIDK